MEVNRPVAQPESRAPWCGSWGLGGSLLPTGSTFLGLLGLGARGGRDRSWTRQSRNLSPGLSVFIQASRVTGEGGVKTVRAADQVPDLVGGVSTGKQAVPLSFLL